MDNIKSICAAIHGEAERITHCGNSALATVHADAIGNLAVRLTERLIPDWNEDDGWVTMKGTHVLIGEEGTVQYGPERLRGKKHTPRTQAMPKVEEPQRIKGSFGDSNTIKTDYQLKTPSMAVVKHRVSKLMESAKPGDRLVFSHKIDDDDPATIIKKEDGWAYQGWFGEEGDMTDDEVLGYVTSILGNNKWGQQRDSRIVLRGMSPEEKTAYESVHYKQKGLKDAHKALIQVPLQKLKGSHKEKWEKAFNETQYDFSDDYPQTCCQHGTMMVHIREDSNNNPRTIVHETGHAIDEGAVNFTVTEFKGTPDEHENHISSGSRYIEHSYDRDTKDRTEKVIPDLRSLSNLTGMSFEITDEEYGYYKWFDEDYDAHEKFRQWFEKETGACTKAGKESLSDIFSAITFNKIGAEYIEGGHDQSYWMQSGSRWKEIWTDYATIKFYEDENAIKVLEKAMPNLYNVLEKVHKEAFGE